MVCRRKSASDCSSRLRWMRICRRLLSIARLRQSGCVKVTPRFPEYAGLIWAKVELVVSLVLLKKSWYCPPPVRNCLVREGPKSMSVCETVPDRPEPPSVLDCGVTKLLSCGVI